VLVRKWLIVNRKKVSLGEVWGGFQGVIRHYWWNCHMRLMSARDQVMGHWPRDLPKLWQVSWLLKNHTVIAFSGNSFVCACYG